MHSFHPGIRPHFNFGHEQHHNSVALHKQRRNKKRKRFERFSLIQRRASNRVFNRKKSAV